MKNTIADIRVTATGPEADALLRYIKSAIVREFSSTVDRINTPAGELVITIAQPFFGAEQEPATAAAEPEPEKAAPDVDPTEACDCPACSTRRFLEGKSNVISLADLMSVFAKVQAART